LIDVEGLTKRYGERLAVDDISFSIPKGQIVGFLGPNGAGKTTTMNIITGYSSATQGRVSVGGNDILEEPEEAKRRIGYLPEQPPLYLELTVDEYLSFAAALKRIPAAARKRAQDRALELTSLADVRGRVIGHLSKGYRQRVGLAQALIAEPELLVLDEPTVGLDPIQIAEIRSLIREIGRERTVILSSHILPEVSAVCERILIIDQGRIVADGPADAISSGVEGSSSVVLRTPAEEGEARRILSAVPGALAITSLGSLEPGSVDFRIDAEKGADLRRDIFYAFAGADRPLIGMRVANLSLEEVFLKLTTKEAEA
jgi:ABC-2 type transport system ATP-binding protein